MTSKLRYDIIPNRALCFWLLLTTPQAGDKGIHAVSGFYKSERFKRGGFQVKGKMIVRSAAPPVPVS